MLHPNKLAGLLPIILIVLAGILILFLLVLSLTKQVNAQGEFFVSQGRVIFDFLISQESILVSLNSFPNYFEQKSSGDCQRVKVIATGYSSTIKETDDTPFITAAGTWVREGIVANNFYPFGTKIKFPELFGEKIFVVEDRMHPRKEDHNVDIWFPSRQEAVNFGAKITEMEVLESQT